MKLPKNDFFETIKGNLEFIHKLNSKDGFILNEVCNEFDINYHVFYKRILYWEAQGFIEKENIATLGGPKYKYRFTVKAKEIIRQL